MPLMVSQNGGDLFSTCSEDALDTIRGSRHIDTGGFHELSTAQFRWKGGNVRYFGDHETIQRLIDEHNKPPKEIREAFNQALTEFYNAGQQLLNQWNRDSLIDDWIDQDQARKCLTMSFDEWLDEFFQIIPQKKGDASAR